MATASAQDIKDRVRQAYGRVARRAEGTQPGSCCEPAQASSCCESAQATSCCESEEEPCCCESEQASSCCESEQESCCCESEQESPCCESEEESCCSPAQSGSCCGPEAKAECGCSAGLYSAEELADLPDSVTQASAGCGNPTAIASLQPGEVVLDLGSGGGIDCFLAARKVGPSGHVIGVDMTPEMVGLARRNKAKVGLDNVEFRLGEMEHLPVADGSVDVIISNCVINLAPDKDPVFAESYRVLKPGGRMSVSDIVTYGELPDVLRRNLEAWAGCLSGALDEGAYLGKMRAAGLTAAEVTQRTYVDVVDVLESEDVQALLAQAAPTYSKEWLRQQLDHKIASVTVTAHKPI
jgi:arsenite methyltransferase